ncbi:hypothetical protein [Halobacillus amylolyticus]|uniref:Uncharacterized protein n=1 Tax=Halobacillus amylolyticus TaxID=2932259 RepID=A0ABY4H6Q0_9BACI|nr:hypothetical protein [Halobacillus amylolyticus]UOR10539.1 hypothetical protein MUO15_12725 [Halobacillus amylolyticus]
MLNKLATTGLALTLGLGIAGAGSVSAEEDESTKVNAGTNVDAVVQSEEDSSSVNLDAGLGVLLEGGLDLDNLLEEDESEDFEEHEEEDGLLGGLL